MIGLPSRHYVADKYAHAMVKRLRELSAVLGLIGIAVSADAQSLDTEVTAFGGYRFGGTFNVSDSDAAYELEDATSFGLIWNHRYQGNTQWEIFYSTQDAEARIDVPSGIVISPPTATALVHAAESSVDPSTAAPYLLISHTFSELILKSYSVAHSLL